MGIASTVAIVDQVMEEQIPELQPGEILVAPATYSAWTSAFSIAKAVVCDSGGSMCHGAIVGREDRLPVVVNTLQATGAIKTGKRIRVDGDLGVVYILS